MKANKKIKCDKCGRIVRTRYIIQFKGKLICSNCKPRIPCGRRAFSLKEALSKVYEVKGNLNKSNNSIRSFISIPSILVGHKVRLVIVE